jgi:hypothetical protein
MRLQRQPNRWSCLPTSFAMVLDVPVEELLRSIGHDGSEIAFPTEPEPACRRGFHIQECIDVALRLGCAVTPIELFPRHAPSFSVQPLRVLFGDEQGNLDRFARLIDSGRGIITGPSRVWRHAVAYDHGIVHDPKGFVYRYSISACQARGLIGSSAWKISRIEPTP